MKKRWMYGVTSAMDERGMALGTENSRRFFVSGIPVKILACTKYFPGVIEKLPI
jgi:hypothetical protein